MGSISFGFALVAGKKRVPNPAAGKTAFLIGFMDSILLNRKQDIHCQSSLLLENQGKYLKISFDNRLGWYFA
ncbi:MAG: hypothetical protein ACWA6R_11440, partial [Nitrosomonas sp.]